jgi:signal transduction histidine kinase
MTTLLAHWLRNNRADLLPQWMTLLEQIPAAVASNGWNDGSSAYDIGAEAPILAHPDEPRLLLEAIYDGLTDAADGNFDPLHESLRLLRAFRTRHGEEELPRHLELISSLRRMVWDRLALGSTADWYPIGVELDRLIDHSALTLTKTWVDRAAAVSRELNETRQVVESLMRDSEFSDRTTLHVSQINDISRKLAASLNATEQITVFGSAMLDVLKHVQITVWQIDEQELCLRAVRHWVPGGPPQGVTSVDWCVPLGEPGDMVAQAFRDGELMVNPQPNAQQQGAWFQPGHIVLSMPLMAQGRANGVVSIQESGGEVLMNRAEQEFIRSAANQTATSLENARLYDEIRSFNVVLEQRIAERTHELKLERDTLETLNSIALEISSTLDEHLLMQNSLAAVARLVDAQHGSISLLERETEHLVDRAVLGRTEGVGFTRFPMGQGIIGWVAQHRKSTLVPDVAADPRWIELPDPGENARRNRTGSMVAVPLIAHHELQGVLVLTSDRINAFHEEHLRLVEASASQIATGIHNALIYQQLEQDLLRRYEMQQKQEQAVSQSQAILQSLSDGVIVCDRVGSVLAVNQAASSILERSQEELLIWNMPELFRRLMGRRSDELPVDDLLTEPRDAQGNLRIYATSFQIGTRMINVTLNPVISVEKQNLMGALAVFRDITREVESDRMKTEFIGTVSHELRTPMTSIKGFTQLLVMGSLGPINETQREFLGIIQNNAERMIAIINDLLDITKIETGSVELELRSLHLAETLSSVMMELQPKIQERGHSLAISIPPGLPLVRADHRRFNQILFNLLSNAVKYTPRNGEISLEAREVGIDVVPEDLREGLRSGRYVQVDVRDTGVGIAPEEHERIFERFYRTENPLKVEAGGTGLGLSLVRPLVTLFGGRVWVKSALNEGSTFTFVLPAA